MNGIFWLDEIIVKAIHEDQLIQHGGLAGVRDNNLFLASLDRPKNLLAYGEPTPRPKLQFLRFRGVNSGVR